MVVAGVSVAAIIVRFFFLRHQDPWLDELTNWQLANEHGFSLRRGGHSLTYISQSIGLALFNNVFGLRFFSAFFGVATVTAATGWITARLGAVAGIVIGLLTVLSPMGIYYSQDANHYAPLILAGLLAMMGTDLSVRQERFRPVVAILFALGIAVTLLYHVLAVFPLGALVVGVFARMMIEPEAIPPFHACRKRKRLWLALIAGVGVLACVPVAISKLPELWNARPADGRHVGLNLDLITTTLGSFYGGIYYLRPIDVVIGAGGFLLSTIGCVLAFRDRNSRGIALAVAVTFATCVLPFTVLSVRQYFSPRYIAPILIPLLTGVCLFGYAGISSVNSALRKTNVGVLIFFLLVFSGRSVHWMAERSDGQFQATRAVIPKFKEIAKPGSVLLTRYPYSSLGMRFLWEREDVADYKLVALSYFFNRGAPSIQQAKEILSEDPDRDVYFTSLIEDEERRARDLSAWLDEDAELVATLPSNSPDPYVPLDWTIRLYKLKREAGDPLSLPRFGAAASNVYPETNAVPAPTILEDAPLYLHPGTGASWNFQTDSTEEGLSITLNQTGNDEQFPVVYIDGLNPFVLDLPISGEEVTVDLPIEIPAGRHQIDIVFPFIRGMRDISRQVLTVHSIDRLGETSGADTSLYRRMKLVDTVPVEPGIISLNELNDHNWPVTVHQVSIKDSLSDAPDNALVLIGQRFYPMGLGDCIVNIECGIDGEFRSMHGPIGWSFAEAQCATVLTGKQVSGGEIEVRARIVERYDFRPRNPTVSFQPIRVYIEEYDRP